MKKVRGLSPTFFSDLQEGILSSFLNCVKNDATLQLAIRENYINIYYRGGNLIRICENNTKDKHIYVPHFDPKYARHSDKKIKSVINKSPQLLESKKDVLAWTDAIPLLKYAMDIWFGKHPKNEREFQQIVLRENNGNTIGSSTDYFIIDIEYDNREEARFDMVALKWDSDSGIRKLNKGFKPTLCFIEMKFGDGAIAGKAGILKHIKDFQQYVVNNKIKSIKSEMLKVFSQQRELKLIPALKHNANKVVSLSDNIEYLFILANHDPASKKLHTILKEVREKYCISNMMGFDLKFCVSNLMGYGIYKESVYSLHDFMNRFSHQILCNS